MTLLGLLSYQMVQPLISHLKDQVAMFLSMKDLNTYKKLLEYALPSLTSNAKLSKMVLLRLFQKLFSISEHLRNLKNG